MSGSPWLGVLVAAGVGLLLGALHAGICQLPRVNDIAIGIGLMLFGTGLAFFLGKPFIQPKAPNLGAIDLGWWSSIPQVRQALQVNYLFFVGIVLAFALAWALKNTRWGLIVRLAGESADAARAIGVLGRPRAPDRDLDRRRLRRHRRRVPVALLPRQLERGPVERPGPDGRGAGDLRALGSGALPVGLAAVRRGRRASARRCSRSASPRATTCSVPRPMCSPWRS